MNRNLIIFAVILLVLVVAAYLTLSGGFLGKTVEVKGQTFKVAIADTDEKRTKGLSGRDNLAQDQGMLFLFDKPGNYPFWMKDMRFPIDIIFFARYKGSNNL